MAQNTSTAVMQRRHEAHDSLDDFPTPPWAVRAFCAELAKRCLIQPGMVVREPAANRGFMVRGLHYYFDDVWASDVHDYGAGFPVEDYLFGPDPEQTHWTITNPPFRLAQQFIERALRCSTFGVAVIVRSAFLEGGQRFHELFGPKPPSLILQHCERVPMVKGRYDPDAASATAYSWVVWHKANPGQPTEFGWIPPCKGKFLMPGDADLEAA